MRNEEKLYMLIGKDKEWAYVIVDYSFKDWNFFWLTWTKMLFHTEQEYEQDKENYIDNWCLKELWQEAVKSDNTELWYDERAEDVIEEEWTDLVYDSSYRCEYWIDDVIELIDKHEWWHATSEFSDCIGGWRCFNQEMLDMDYWEWVDKENFKKFKKLYNEFEKPNDDKAEKERARQRLKDLYTTWLFSQEEAKELWIELLDLEKAKEFNKKYPKHYVNKDLLNNMKD